MPEISPIDHARALREKWVDRYLLKELSSADSETFERHYFECEECAAAVEAGDLFIINARDVLSEVPREEARAGFWQSLGLGSNWKGFLLPATSLALAVVAVYQGAVVIPRLSAPRVLPAFQLISASRGDARILEVPSATPAIALSIDVPPDAHLAQYTCDLRSSGKTIFTLTSAPPAPGQPITILVPAKGLEPGKYELVLRGGPDQPGISTSSFEVRFR